jgi:hypothetical protein
MKRFLMGMTMAALLASATTVQAMSPTAASLEALVACGQEAAGSECPFAAWQAQFGAPCCPVMNTSVSWFTQALQQGMSAWQCFRGTCSGDGCCRQSGCNPAMNNSVKQVMGTVTGHLMGAAAGGFVGESGTCCPATMCPVGKKACAVGVCGSVTVTAAPCACAKECACCETCKAKKDAGPCGPQACPFPVCPPMGMMMPPCQAAMCMPPMAGPGPGHWTPTTNPNVMEWVPGHPIYDQAWQVRWPQMHAVAMPKMMPYPNPMPAEAMPCATLQMVSKTTVATRARAHLATPDFDAHCERMSHKGDMVVLEGDVLLMWKKNVRQPMRIEAQRVVLNTQDGSFVVEPASANSACESSSCNPVGREAVKIFYHESSPSPSTFGVIRVLPVSRQEMVAPLPPVR